MLNAWVQRLKEQTNFDVKGAAELAAARQDQKRDGLYVILADDRAGENQLLNGVRQQRTIGVSVVLAIRNRRDRRGEAALTEIEAARGQVMQALIGWQPSTETGPVIYRSGRLVALAETTVWWQDEFEVTEIIGGVA